MPDLLNRKSSTDSNRHEPDIGLFRNHLIKTVWSKNDECIFEKVEKT